MKKIAFFFTTILITLVLVASSVLAQEDQEHAGEGRCYSDSSLPGCFGNSDGVPPPGEQVPAAPSAPSAPSVSAPAPIIQAPIIQMPPVVTIPTLPIVVADTQLAPVTTNTITNNNTNVSNNTNTNNNRQAQSQNVQQIVNVPVGVGGGVGVGNTSSVGNAGIVTSSPRVVFAGTTQLPKTGLPELAWGLVGLAPVGYSLKRFGQNFKSNSTSAYYVWEKRHFKMTP